MDKSEVSRRPATALSVHDFFGRRSACLPGERTVALGEDGHKVAEACKNLGLEARACLADVLPRLAATSVRRVGELTAARLAASRGG